MKTLDLGHKQPGYYLGQHEAAYWNGSNNLGEEAASGIYYYSIRAGDFYAMRRLVLVK